MSMNQQCSSGLFYVFNVISSPNAAFFDLFFYKMETLKHDIFEMNRQNGLNTYPDVS